MRTFVVTLILLCASLACSSAGGEELVYFGSDSQDSDFFYDSESLSFPSTNIIRVWKKRLFSEEAKKHFIEDRTEAELSTVGYDELSYALIREEINCKTRKSNILAIYYLSKTGNIIARVTVPGRIESWDTLYPGSIGDMLRKTVCTLRNTVK
jgi:hypothetical protein